MSNVYRLGHGQELGNLLLADQPKTRYPDPICIDRPVPGRPGLWHRQYVRWFPPNVDRGDGWLLVMDPDKIDDPAPPEPPTPWRWLIAPPQPQGAPQWQ